jgi:metal-sulfur cluster biosynthetic enzyme
MDNVIDPHMRASLNAMGMISNVDVSREGKATIGMVFPCVGCPAFDVIQHDAKVAAKTVPGIEEAVIKLDWASTWSKAHMSDEARALAKEHGYVI